VSIILSIIGKILSIIGWSLEMVDFPKFGHIYAQQIVVDKRGCTIIWAVDNMCWWSMIDVSHAINSTHTT